MTAQLLVPSLSPNQELPNPDKPHAMQFTVEQFQLMYERGVFADSDRYELINGEIIAMMWLFDVNTKTIMGFSQPSELGYKQTCLYTQGDRLSILAFDDVVFEWQELF
jgi:Uma2 family endonuclease